jgi:DNA-binding GntR family transcriptional regulator
VLFRSLFPGNMSNFRTPECGNIGAEDYPKTMGKTSAATTGRRKGGGRSIAERAYQRLRLAIVECRLAPGQRLTEASIAQKLQVGETPAREALRRLVQEGLVRVAPRHGYAVAPITLRDVHELFELRLLIEPATAGMAAVNSPAAPLARLKELSRVGYADGGQDSVRKFLRANTELHAHIAHLSGNHRIAQLLNQLLSESERLINFGMLSHPQSETTVGEHQKLLEALADRDANSAREIMEKHIIATRQMVVESLIANTSLREIPIGV